MIRHLTLALPAALFCSVAHAQQGNLPPPVQKLPPYPPVVCVAPNWATESCEDRHAGNEPGDSRSEWQCGNVKVIVSFQKNETIEYRLSGLEKSSNRFKYVFKNGGELYLNDRLCKSFPQLDKTKSLPSEPPVDAKPKTVLYDEPGGIIRDQWKRWEALALSGDDVEIRGSCVSACTLILAHIPNDRLCFGESASLQFHLAQNKETGEANIESSRWMLNHYPQDIRLWLGDKGGVEKMPLKQTWTLSAAELWAMGYRRCGPEEPRAEEPPVPMTVLRTKTK